MKENEEQGLTLSQSLYDDFAHDDGNTLVSADPGITDKH
jgi:hypothetical protein